MKLSKFITSFCIFAILLVAVVVVFKFYSAPTSYVKDTEFYNALRQQQLIIDSSKRKVDSLNKVELTLRAQMKQINSKLQKDSIKIINLKLKLNETHSSIDTFSSRDVVDYFNNRYGSN